MQELLSADEVIDAGKALDAMQRVVQILPSYKHMFPEDTYNKLSRDSKEYIASLQDELATNEFLSSAAEAAYRSVKDKRKCGPPGPRGDTGVTGPTGATGEIGEAGPTGQRASAEQLDLQEPRVKRVKPVLLVQRVSAEQLDLQEPQVKRVKPVLLVQRVSREFLENKVSEEFVVTKENRVPLE